MSRDKIIGWQKLGWDHPMWEILRLYHAVGARGSGQAAWVSNLKSNGYIKLEDNSKISIKIEIIKELEEYIKLRNTIWTYAEQRLRKEPEALAYCSSLGVIAGVTATKSQDHHQASKALVAAVSKIAADVCKTLGTTANTDPQTRCTWLINESLHVTARRLDGAAPTLVNPKVIWEIKEYWGVTSGGSKMSDAVYECHLVGRELIDYRMKTGKKIEHYVFIDGKEQWIKRKSDMLRFFDLNAQGLIDRLYIGKDVEDFWSIELQAAMGK